MEVSPNLALVGSMHSPHHQQANATQNDDSRKDDGSGAIGPVKLHNAAIEICHGVYRVKPIASEILAAVFPIEA